jgi:hypothetical protein
VCVPENQRKLSSIDLPARTDNAVVVRSGRHRALLPSDATRTEIEQPASRAHRNLAREKSRPHGIDGQMARSTAARPKARRFGPAQARHGLVTSVLGLAQPVFRARAWAATPARRADRHDTKIAGRPGSGPLIPTVIYKQPQILKP